MQNILELQTPLDEEVVSRLKVGDVISISGFIFCGRDAVLPRICRELQDGSWQSR